MVQAGGAKDTAYLPDLAYRPHYLAASAVSVSELTHVLHMACTRLVPWAGPRMHTAYRACSGCSEIHTVSFGWVSEWLQQAPTLGDGVEWISITDPGTGAVYSAAPALACWDGGGAMGLIQPVDRPLTIHLVCRVR